MQHVRTLTALISGQGEERRGETPAPGAQRGPEGGRAFPCTPGDRDARPGIHWGCKELRSDTVGDLLNCCLTYKQYVVYTCI